MSKNIIVRKGIKTLLSDKLKSHAIAVLKKDDDLNEKTGEKAMIKGFLKRVIERFVGNYYPGDEYAIHLQPISKKKLTACGLSSISYGGMHQIFVSSKFNEVTCEECKRSKEYLELTNQRIRKLYGRRGRK